MYKLDGVNYVDVIRHPHILLSIEFKPGTNIVPTESDIRYWYDEFATAITNGILWKSAVVSIDDIDSVSGFDVEPITDEWVYDISIDYEVELSVPEYMKFESIEMIEGTDEDVINRGMRTTELYSYIEDFTILFDSEFSS